MANRFWVGGTATWDATAGTKWATTSGGVGGAAAPTSADDVIFDANSGSGVVTIAAGCVARSVDCNLAGSSFTGTWSSGVGATLTVGDSSGGKFRLSPSMTISWATGSTSINLISTSNNGGAGWDVNCYNKGTTGGSGLVFNGVGGKWVCSGSINMSGCTVSNGAVDFGTGLTHTFGVVGWTSNGFGTRSMALNDCIFNVGASISFAGANLTTTTTSSVINMAGGVSSFGVTATGSVVLSTVNLKPTASPAMQTAQITSNPTITTLAFIPFSHADFFGVFPSWNATITDFNISGVSADSPTMLASTTHGTTVTITATNKTLSDVIFMDITAGGAAWTGTRLHDGLGNSNITFTAAQTNYWVGGTGNWSDVNHWASTSGGAGASGRVPMAHDTVRVDGNSGAGTITSNRFCYGKHIDFTGSSITTWAMHQASNALSGYWYIWGSLTVPATVTCRATGAASGKRQVFVGRGAETIDLNGGSFNWEGASNGFVQLLFSSPNGSYKFLSDFVTLHDMQWSYSPFTGGSNPAGPMTLDFNDKNITMRSWSDVLSTNVRTLALGTGTIKFTAASGSVWSTPNQANLTFTGNPNFIVPETFDGYVTGGAYRIPQPGSDRIGTPVSTDSQGANLWATPSPSTALTGDLDIRVKLSMDTWTPAVNQTVMGKWDTFPASSLQWFVYVNTTGNIVWQQSTNGSAIGGAGSTAAVPFTAGQTGWIRVTRTSSTGGFRFYTSTDSTDDPTAVNWTNLGLTNQTATSGALFAGLCDLGVGSLRGNLDKGMTFYYAGVSNSTSLWTPVGEINFTKLQDWSLTATDTQGNLWRNYQASCATSRRVLGGRLDAVSGSTNSCWSTPDSAALSITGDIEIQARIHGWNWSTGSGIITGKWGSSSQASYRLTQAAGTIRLDLTATGSTGALVQAQPAVTMTAQGYPNGSSLWVKVTWRQSDGRVQFWTAPDAASPPAVGAYTQLGTDLTIAIASIFDGTSGLELGSCLLGTSGQFSGSVYRVRILNGIGGTVVFDADITTLADDTFAFNEAANNAVVHFGVPNSTVSGARTLNDWAQVGKTVPGTLTIPQGSGRVFYLHGTVNGTVLPTFNCNVPHWIAASQSFNQTVPSMSLQGRPTARSALYTASDNAITTITSSGTINVSCTDVYKVSAAGASIPFNDADGTDGGSNTNWTFNSTWVPKAVLM